MTPRVRAPRLGEMSGRDPARRAGPELPERVRLEDGHELRARGIEQRHDEGRAVRRGRVQLPAGQAEPVVDGRHVGERALRERQPAPRGDLHRALRHPSEASLDRFDRRGRVEHRGDVGLRQVQGHRRSLGGLGGTGLVAEVPPVGARRGRREPRYSNVSGRPRTLHRVDPALLLRQSLLRQALLKGIGAGHSSAPWRRTTTSTCRFATCSTGSPPTGWRRVGARPPHSRSPSRRGSSPWSRAARPGWADAPGIAAQANAISDRATTLARADGHALGRSAGGTSRRGVRGGGRPKARLRARAEARGGRSRTARDRGARVRRDGAGSPRSGARRRDLSRRRRSGSRTRRRRRHGGCTPRPREPRNSPGRPAARACASERGGGEGGGGSSPLTRSVTIRA